MKTIHLLELLGAAVLMCLAASSFATDVREGTSGACIPASERAGREFGCFIVAAQPVGSLDQPAFWHVETFPNRAAAETAKTAHGAVIEAFGKVWLLTIADSGWQSQGGTHLAQIGPIPTTPG